MLHPAAARPCWLSVAPLQLLSPRHAPPPAACGRSCWVAGATRLRCAAAAAAAAAVPTTAARDPPRGAAAAGAAAVRGAPRSSHCWCHVGTAAAWLQLFYELMPPRSAPAKGKEMAHTRVAIRLAFCCCAAKKDLGAFCCLTKQSRVMVRIGCLEKSPVLAYVCFSCPLRIPDHLLNALNSSSRAGSQCSLDQVVLLSLLTVARGP